MARSVRSQVISDRSRPISSVLLLDGAEHADEDLVAAGDDRGRRVGGAEERARLALAVGGGEVPGADQVLGAGDAAPGEGLDEAALPLAAGKDVGAGR